MAVWRKLWFGCGPFFAPRGPVRAVANAALDVTKGTTDFALGMAKDAADAPGPAPEHIPPFPYKVQGEARREGLRPAVMDVAGAAKDIAVAVWDAQGPAMFLWCTGR